MHATEYLLPGTAVKSRDESLSQCWCDAVLLSDAMLHRPLGGYFFFFSDEPILSNVQHSSFWERGVGGSLSYQATKSETKIVIVSLVPEIPNISQVTVIRLMSTIYLKCYIIFIYFFFYSSIWRKETEERNKQEKI